MAKHPTVPWNPRLAAAINARRHLPPLVSAYFAEARRLLKDVHDPAGFHRLRLISKRLRYTLELFRPCYTRAMDERLAALKRVQELLGDINDAVVAGRLIEDRPGAVRMHRHLEKLVAQKAGQFRTQWQNHFDAPN